jgi:hypothetical protein
MPEISRFFGIIIAMFAKDHVPPHFHAKYGEFKATFDINTGELLDGNLPGERSDLYRIGQNFIRKN